MPFSWIQASPYVFVFLWSTGFVVAKLGMIDAQPLAFLAWRLSLSWLLLSFIAIVLRSTWPREKMQYWHIGFSGTLIQAGYLGGIWVAVSEGMSAGLAALVVALQPILTGVWTSYIGEKLSGQKWLGLLLGFLGVGLVVWTKTDLGELSTISSIGVSTALAAITIGTIYQKHWVQPISVWPAIAIQLTPSSLLMIGLATLGGQTMVWTLSSTTAMAWSVIVLTAGASALLFFLIQRRAAVNVSSLMYCVPPTAALMGFLMFDEHINLTTVAGTILVVIAMIMVQKPPKENRQ